jgi:superfamily II DNA helicase RecQ
LLGSFQVLEMEKINIQAAMLDAENIKTLYGSKTQIYTEVRRCQWPVVIVSPERLVSPEFDEIVRDTYFRRNLCLYVIDEAHVVDPWGKSYRKAYSDIGAVCNRIPPDVPVLAMTATCRPELTKTLLSILSFRENEYSILRRPCEKRNLRIVYQSLTHGLGGDEFTDIQWIASCNFKVIVYCTDYDLCYRVSRYLRRLLPLGNACSQAVCVYHSLVSSKHNEKALTAFNEDPHTFVMVATIKFGMGIDIRNVQVVVNLCFISQ